MPFKVLKFVFLKSTRAEFCATKYNSVMLKTKKNQSSIEHFDVCTVKSRNKDKSV